MTQMWDVFPFPRIFCTDSYKKAKRYVKKMTDGEVKYAEPKYEGQASFYEAPNGDGENFCVVYVNCDGYPRNARIALLAHECSHVVDFIQDDMGEENLGTETRANLMQAAMRTCLDQLGDEWL